MALSKYSISDIAKICGVSKATISRVINNKPDGVSKETKKRIEKVIKDLNYRPNSLARGVATSQSGIIGLVIPDVTNLFYPVIIGAVNDCLTKHGFTMLLSNSDYSPEKEQEQLLAMVDKRVEGIIFCSGVSNEEFLAGYKEHGIPLVSIGRAFDNYLCDASISGDNFSGAVMAADYLVKKGNKEIAYMDGNLGISGAAQRFEGVKQAMSDNGIEHDESLNFFGDFSIEYGYHTTKELLKKKNERVTAIMTGSDLIAIGVLRALYEEGINVPNEMEVMGFDNIKLSEITTPQLSTVSKPHYDMAYSAAEMLISLIHGTLGEMRNLVVTPHIVLRGTTKPDTK